MEVQNGTEQCRKIHYRIVRFSSEQYCTAWHSSLQKNTVQYAMVTLQHVILHYKALHHSIVQFKTTECGAIQKTNMIKVE